MKAYIEHAAYYVQEYDWYLKFFAEVFELQPYRERTVGDLRECWLDGGIQLCESRQKQEVDGRCAHLCLLVYGLDELREKALAMGAEPMEKHHWVMLPDGLQLEMFEAADGTVEALQAVPKRKK